MKFQLAALTVLLAAAPAAAQPIIIPLNRQHTEGQQPPASPVPVAPPQAEATPGTQPQPGSQQSAATSAPDSAGSARPASPANEPPPR